MYPYPPTVFSSTFTTNATANTGTVHTLVAAAAGFRCRVHSINVNLLQNEPAANIFRFLLQDSVANYWGWTAYVNHTPQGPIFPFPGLLFPAADGIFLQSFCIAVSRSFNVQLNYYRETT